MPALSFGRYDPLFRIAAGGMAEVYAARIRGEAGFQKLVAVKRMLPHLADDEEFVAMFLDEGRLAANIASPHVVSTLDLGRTDDGSLYIVMELVVGTALSTLVRASGRKGHPIPVPIACEIIAQAASGLDDAHEARTPTGVHLGIIHRDISPQNVLVGVDGRTRVVDFGVARAVLRQSHTSTGTLKGKFAYFSPEQAAAKELDRRSDVFALGIVAWETLLSRRLFEADNPLEQITRVRSMPIPRPSALRADVPEAVSDVVMRALQRDLDQRWESAGAFAAALRQASHTTVTGREIGALVTELVGPAVREMQSRIEASLAGEDLVTQHAMRTPSREMPDPMQATPSAPSGHIVDLPTLIKPPTGPLPSEPTPILTMTESAPRDMRVIVAIATMAVLAMVLIAVLASRPPTEPVATPLPTATVPRTTIEAPPPTRLEVPVPSLVPASEVATRTSRRPASSAVTPPPPTRIAPPVSVVQAPPATTARSVPPPSTLARSAPPPPTTTAAPRHTDTARHPAGLAGDDAFDQGI